MIEVLVNIFGWEAVAAARSRDYSTAILANRDSLIAAGRELLASMKLGEDAVSDFADNLDSEMKYHLIAMLVNGLFPD